MKVPPVLFSGDHEKIDAWRRRKALEKTIRRRPDLIAASGLTPEERTLLEPTLNERKKR
jgi:tRNA (guanine37-N1)-methyltransferase